MAKPFQTCILFEEIPGTTPADISGPWDMAEVPVALLVHPFDSRALWTGHKAEIESWHLPPIKASSHFLQFFGLAAAGPEADWDQLVFWSRRAMRRLGELGVQVVGVYGSFFKIPDGYDKTRGMDQGLDFLNMLGDEAGRHGMVVALEPMGDPKTLWPRYRDGLAMCRQLGRPELRVMADMAYFSRLDQRFEDILEEPDWCVHCHIAGDGAQPGVGQNEEQLLHFFRVLKEAGYEGGVSAACPWVPSEGETLDLAKETAKSAAYILALRDRVYAE
jgi:sugar phosphate isomerase/epimerase